jgi:hypothetical protein
MLERKLQDAEVPVEEKNNILKHLEKKETEYMRLQRHKMGVEDFELLTIIGRGAFGEVMFVSVSIVCLPTMGLLTISQTSAMIYMAVFLCPFEFYPFCDSSLHTNVGIDIIAHKIFPQNINVDISYNWKFVLPCCFVLYFTNFIHNSFACKKNGSKLTFLSLFG